MLSIAEVNSTSPPRSPSSIISCATIARGKSAISIRAYTISFPTSPRRLGILARRSTSSAVIVLLQQTNLFAPVLQESPRTAFTFKRKPLTCACRGSTRLRCAAQLSRSLAEASATTLTRTLSMLTSAASGSGASTVLLASLDDDVDSIVTRYKIPLHHEKNRGRFGSNKTGNPKAGQSVGNGRTYSTRQAAQMAGVHWVTLRRWLASGRIRSTQAVPYIGRTLWRWTDADIERVKKYKQENYRKGRGRKP